MSSQQVPLIDSHSFLTGTGKKAEKESFLANQVLFRII